MMDAGIGQNPGNQNSPQYHLTSSTEKTAQTLAAMRGLHTALFQDPNLLRFANTSLDYAIRVVGGQAGSLILASPENKYLQFFLSKGVKPVPRGTQVAWNLGIAGHVFHSGKSEFVSDPSSDPRHLHQIDQLTGYTTQNLIATPIKNLNGYSLGVVEILNASQGSPSEEDAVFLQILASYISMALHRDGHNPDTQREAMSIFVKDCAHDMKNMLMPILDGKDFLKDELVEIFGNLPYRETIHMQKNIITCKESLDMIDRNARRLQKKAKDLVDCLMGHCSAKECKPCSIKHVTKEVLDTLSFPINKKNLAIELRGLEELPLIQADERKLFSVFYNLLHNGVAAIQKGGTIGIHGYPEEHNVCVNIIDNGPGIPQQEINVLFSGKKISKKSLGNGFGMKSVRNAVEEHGGFIKIESTVGTGTTIHISLPKGGLTFSSTDNTECEVPKNDMN